MFVFHGMYRGLDYIYAVQTAPKSSRIVLFVREAECGTYAGYKVGTKSLTRSAFNRLIYLDVVQLKQSQVYGECCQTVDCDLASRAAASCHFYHTHGAHELSRRCG